MSSILDALNKVEEEQEQLKAQESIDPQDIDLGDAVNDFVDQDLLRDKMTLRVSPMMLLGGGFASFVVLVGVVAWVVASVMRPEDGSVDPITSVASNTVPTEHVDPIDEIPAPNEDETLKPPPEPEVTPLVEERAESASTTPVVEEVIAPTPAEPTVAPTATLAATPKPDPKPMIEKTPDPLPKPTTTVLDSEGPLNFSSDPPNTEAIPTSPRAESPPVRDVPINTYPPFTPGVQLRYGLDTFKVNMISPKSARNPYGSAIINRKKVFEGGFIAGSQVMLYKVEKDGFALEIPRTGQRYFKSF